jgi:hypothetical protein
MRRAGVDADAHADRTPRERCERLICGVECIGRRREGDEERISLRIDLDTAVGSEHMPQDPAVLGKRLGVGGSAKLVQQPCRALHVGEKERDYSRGKIASHGLHDAASRGAVVIAPSGSRIGSSPEAAGRRILERIWNAAVAINGKR